MHLYTSCILQRNNKSFNTVHVFEQYLFAVVWLEIFFYSVFVFLILVRVSFFQFHCSLRRISHSKGLWKATPIIYDMRKVVQIHRFGLLQLSKRRNLCQIQSARELERPSTRYRWYALLFSGESFHRYCYKYSRDIMMMYIFHAVNTESATYADAANNVYGHKMLNDLYFMIVLDERHPHCSARLLRDGSSAIWDADPLHMNYTFRGECKAISPTQDINWSKLQTSVPWMCEEMQDSQTIYRIFLGTRQHLNKILACT